MRLRKIKAANMREAMARVRDELGEDAVIVSTWERPDGMVEVTAAAERKQPKPEPREPGEPRRLTGEAMLENQLRARLRAENRAETGNGGDDPTWVLAEIERALAFNGLSGMAAAPLLKSARSIETSDTAHALAHALDATTAFQPIADDLNGSVMLIGAPGSGKTVTSAKLAARAVLAGQPVDIISADAIRTGGFAQAEAFAKVLGQDACEVRGPDELAMLLDTRAELGRERPCVIDTPAANPFDRGELEFIAKLVQAARPTGVEPIAVIAAGSDPADTADTARAFARLGCRRAIVTRMDAAGRLGAVLSIHFESGLAYAAFGTKPYIAGGLENATPRRLAAAVIEKTSAHAASAALLPHEPPHRALGLRTGETNVSQEQEPV